MTVDVTKTAGMDLSEFLIPGVDYTFIFQIKSVQVTESDVLIDLQSVPGLSGVHLPFFSVWAERMDISFTWAGDGATVVANVADSIKQAIEGNHWLTTVDMVKAVSGTEAAGGLFAAGSTGAGIAPGLGSVFSDVKTLAVLALVGLALLVAFEGISTVKGVA